MTLYDICIREMVNQAPTIGEIPLDKVKKARKEIENLTPWWDDLVEMYDVLEILDKLIKEYESEENK